MNGDHDLALMPLVNVRRDQSGNLALRAIFEMCCFPWLNSADYPI